jgi:protein phosphatase
MFYCCGATDKGGVRSENEDAFLIGRKVITDGVFEQRLAPPFIAAVADGVAGELGGGEASAFALKLLSRLKVAERTDYVKSVLAIHERLRKRGVANKSPNMQTTLCAVAVGADGVVHAVNVGDSRLYRYRGGVVKQLSTDQSLVQALYERGGIANEQKFRHSQKNVIFPVVGSLNSEPSVAVSEIDGGVSRGDVILLCTDGLSDYVTAGEIEETLAAPQKLLTRLISLIDKAIGNGGADNITAVILFRED